MVCWLEPGARTAPDKHTQRELVLVRAGAGLIESESAHAQLVAGDVLLIESGEPHVVVAGDDGLEWLSIYWPRIEVPA
jgi:quercetin dioxygenase-like cupin family protein